MGRVHLVGPKEAGLAGSASPPPRSRGLRDLTIAIVAGALIWIGDRATGRHLEHALAGLAVRLSDWYEERRRLVVSCRPDRPVEYRKLAGITFKVPECWSVEESSLLDREVHRFHDPEARAGTLSISVEPAETREDAEALQAEFQLLARRPGAVVDGAKNRRSDEPLAAPAASLRPSGFDGLADRILNPESAKAADAGDRPAPENGEGSERSTREDGEESNAGDSATARPTAARAAAGASGAARLFRRVEIGGLVPLDDRESSGGSGSGPDHAKRTWHWLLVGDRVAVRMVYAVRADWANSPIVTEEFKRVQAVADSIRPAPGGKK